MTGKVYLVGAGPGDPGLITVKGLECIKKADVVIYDYLAASAHLVHVSENAELIYVGKKGGDHTLSQDGINALIVEKAKTGAIITRLKGGDPFIFGRGGEEAEILIRKKIPFEIVPGVTSAIAAPAYAGIPLTHRNFTSTLAFITGHENPEKSTSSINWASLPGIGTLVFFMGVKNLANIVERLLHHGMPPEKPVALVRWGTTPSQLTVSGTLADIVARVEKAGLKAPAIIVVGDVVKLRNNLQWFETRPLYGKTIVVTRAREQASDLIRQLTDLGAECMECPTIKINRPEDLSPLDRAIAHLNEYQWIIFTSVNGVRFFFDRLFENGLDVRALHSLKTASIGPATAAKLFEYGIKSDIVPVSYRAESVVAAFQDKYIQGSRILLPRAAKARPILPVELNKMGAKVDEIIAYQTLQSRDNAASLITGLNRKRIDLITFTSSSTVKNFKALMPDDAVELLQGVKIASIGPITSDTARKEGFDVHVTAKTYTIPGLCGAIVKYFQKNLQQNQTP